MKRHHLGISLALLAGITSAPLTASAVELAAHEAIYRITLVETSRKGAVVQSQGALGIRFKRYCNSWQRQSELLFTMDMDNGKSMRIHRMLRTRENVKGGRIEFTGWTESNRLGKINTRGNARVPENGDPGEVIFEKPSKDQHKLAIGMGLPTASFMAIMEQLLLGETPAPAHYFDPNSKYTEMKLLGGAPTILEKPPEGDSELVEGRSWRLRVTPVYEEVARNELGAHTILQVHANGVASHMIIDLGEVRLNAVLIKVRKIEASGCAAPAPVNTPKAQVSQDEAPQEGISIDKIPNGTLIGKTPNRTAPADTSEDPQETIQPES